MTERQQLLRSRPWAELKRAARLQVDDVVHTPSGPMVVLRRAGADAPSAPGYPGRVRFEVDHYDSPSGRPRRVEMRWPPHLDLLVVGYEQSLRMQLWLRGGPSFGHYRETPAQAEGMLF